ncbi:uncharacterized protein PAC_17506 [Phialocephala subalpina]|uniref:Uncharacterized protein n=1 Tax=Phialocephala subalpina TaxID=576137 RepID=A0A1L7XRP9_9HELO|nr:uncharacterized protein PAC_17506 [Phialocephala subalpina]
MGFTWGMIHLVLTLKLSTVGIGSSDWAFGQVVPIVLLAAPVVAIVEFFYEDDEAEIPVNTTTSTSSPSASVMKRNGGVQNQATLSTPSSGTDQASNAQNSEDEYNAQLSTTAHGRVETLQIADNLSNSPIEGLRDEPDFDFYVEASWFTWIIIFTLCSVCTVSIGWTSRGDDSRFLVGSIRRGFVSGTHAVPAFDRLAVLCTRRASLPSWEFGKV